MTGVQTCALPICILSKYRTKDGFETYDKLTTADRNALKGPITTLAEDLAQLRGILGLD